MNTAPLIAEIAGLVGEPARASIMTALLDGRALTAGELAYAARVTPQTASMHLSKLAEARLIAPLKTGRHRYFRLASPRVAQMLESIMAVAIDERPRYRPLSPLARELRSARVCYDHFAGQLGIALADSLSRSRFVLLDEEGAEVTPSGARFLEGFGIDLYAAGMRRRRFCRSCLDWTERRPHIGGAVGAALARRCFEIGWTERKKDSRAVIVTATGRKGFRETFGLVFDEPCEAVPAQRATGSSAAR